MKPSSIIALILILGTLAGAWFLVLPNIDKISIVQEDLLKERESLDTLRQAEATIRRNEAFYNSLSEEEKEIVSLAAPDEPDKHDIVVILNKFVNDSRLDLSQISAKDLTSNLQQSGPLSKIPVTLEMGGVYQEYGAFKEFLKNIEHTLRILDISRVAVRTVQLEDSILLIFTVDGDAYYAAQ